MSSDESLHQQGKGEEPDQKNDKSNEASDRLFNLDVTGPVAAVAKHIEALLGRIERLHMDSAERNQRENEPRDGVSERLDHGVKDAYRTSGKHQERAHDDERKPCHDQGEQENVLRSVD